MGVVSTERSACGIVNCLRVRICAVKGMADKGSETETVRSTAVAACFCFFCELRSDVFCSLWSAGEFSSTVVCISLAGQTLTRRERVW